MVVIAQKFTPGAHGFFVDDYWLDCEDPENERRPEVSPISVTTKLRDDCSVL